MAREEQNGDKLGYHAKRPSEVPAPGLWEVAKRVWEQIGTDHVQLVSAGVAFYFLLALFPLFAAAVSIYGLIMDPLEVEAQVNRLTVVLPQQAQELISTILQSFAQTSEQTLGWSLIVSIVLSLWGAKKGINAVFDGVSIAYNEKDDRNIFVKAALTLVFTLGGVIMGLITLTLVVGFPAVVDKLPLPPTIESMIAWLRWLLLAFLIMMALGVIYKVAPHRHDPKARWVSWGAAIATVLWLLGSALFSYFVDNFGNYDKTYGSFAAIIVLMLWFLLTAFSIVLGAEINSELEHQTCEDSTTGKERPQGQRGAFYADHHVTEDVDT